MLFLSIDKRGHKITASMNRKHNDQLFNVFLVLFLINDKTGLKITAMNQNIREKYGLIFKSSSPRFKLASELSRGNNKDKSRIKNRKYEKMDEVS